MAVPRIGPEEVRRKLKAGETTLLVCAYDDPEKCHQYELEGAVSLGELETMKDNLQRNRELVFYCA